jgi:hypothetical protein
MNMKVRYAFARVRSAVDDNSISGLVDLQFLRDLASDEQ